MGNKGFPGTTITMVSYFWKQYDLSNLRHGANERSLHFIRDQMCLCSMPIVTRFLCLSLNVLLKVGGQTVIGLANM